MNRSSGKAPRASGGGAHVEIYFDPKRPDKELFDTLAEKQADQLKINSAQLRRFFGEIKDLYRQFNSLAADKTDPKEKEELYQEKIAARFKMIRSKVFYAQRRGGQGGMDKGESRNFGEFLKHGIAQVEHFGDFVKFVMHLEAVVGFMYGKERVTR